MSLLSRVFVSSMLVLLVHASLIPTPGRSSAPNGSWPTFRGPELDGTAPATGALAQDRFGLEPLWTRELGSGYSSISISGETGVTLFSDGKKDLVFAFDTNTGDERWRYEVAETYGGHSGSDDGPLSTPAIADGIVYGLAPYGQLFALRLSDGEAVWHRKLDGKSDSRIPHYGFSTSPLVVNDALIVQTGGENGHSITAFDRNTGTPRWSTEDDPVSYQSPTVLELCGKKQIVAATDHLLLGIDPESGSVIWSHEHKTQAYEAFAIPLSLGENRVLLNSLAEVVTVRVDEAAGAYKVEELWRSRDFKNSYALPVLHEGSLFGFSARFLSCLDAKTGELRWRSRPPGGMGLIRVGKHLAILSPDGELVLVEATEKEYREAARLKVLDRGYHTPPSFAGGRFYVRNLTHLASVRVTSNPTAKNQSPVAERVLRGRFGEFVRKVEQSAEKQGLLEEFFSDDRSFPLVEDEGLVHFVYRGEVQDIALESNFIPMGEDAPMDRIAGTDVYFKSVVLDREGCYDYRYNVDFGTPMTDPANSSSSVSLFGPVSVLRMPEFDRPQHSEEREGDEGKGRIDSFQFKAEKLAGERRIQLYVPADYATSGETRYPLLVVLHGDRCLEHGKIKNTLDNLIHDKKMAPVLAVLLTGGFAEYGGDQTSSFLSMLDEEILPHIDRHYRTDADPSRNALLGAIDGAFMAVYAAAKLPERFGKAATQTPYFNPLFRDELTKLVGDHSSSADLYVEVRRQDFTYTGGTIDSRKDSEWLLEIAAGSGFRVHKADLPGSWGWESWQSGWDEILTSFFPLAIESEETTEATKVSGD